MTLRIFLRFLKSLIVFALIFAILVISAEYIFKASFRTLPFYIQFAALLLSLGIISLANILISNYHSKKGAQK